MQLSSEQRIGAPQQRVWEALNDTEVLRKSIPGCESIIWLNKSELATAVTVKVGSVKAKFTGKIILSDVDPPPKRVSYGW